ncbi:hypothetical protein Y981_09515 [Leptospirillum ferriphilum YSK]|uniref:Uncharacterized protein n=1 Tax=Leptospirillum ferriphilum YSK TaxID=1441628 RepID=A0A059XXQ1_9BACT|nr:hypothetical protein Y981_09515 [Leptospirillum ferriphilum YSK]
MKTGKGRVRQRIEDALAIPAPETREPGNVFPRPAPKMVVMGTSGRGSNKRNHLSHQILLVPMLDRSFQLMTLRECLESIALRHSWNAAFFIGITSSIKLYLIRRFAKRNGNIAL